MCRTRSRSGFSSRRHRSSLYARPVHLGFRPEQAVHHNCQPGGIENSVQDSDQRGRSNRDLSRVSGPSATRGIRDYKSHGLHCKASRNRAIAHHCQSYHQHHQCLQFWIDFVDRRSRAPPSYTFGNISQLGCQLRAFKLGVGNFSEGPVPCLLLLI